jgi:hypothetical protein
MVIGGCVSFVAANAAETPVLDWNALMIEAIRTDNSGPTLSARNLAILHVAIYDAVNSISGRAQPYHTHLIPPDECSAEAAATAAGHEVINSLYPGVKARSDSLLEDFVLRSSANAALTNGLAFGSQIARTVLNSRASDGSSIDIPYIPNDEPGNWLRTPPFFRPPVAPHWRYVDLFGLPGVARFVPPPPPVLASAEYAAAVNEVQILGARDSSVRTVEQTEIATFWSDFSYTSMPPGHWHLIAESIARQRALSLDDSARLFALISIAQADAGVVCWEAKYRYNLWRPVTAIQRADEDQNPATTIDTEWISYLNSPPFPSYSSGHSTFSMASAEVIGRFFGTDQISFVATSDSLPGVFRSFQSLKACADEVGMSRIYGGIHYSFDNVEGKKSGQAIGQYIATNYLLPNDSLPALGIEGVVAGQLQIRLHGRFGLQMVLERSSDLENWTELTTHQPTSGGTLVTQPASGTSFFRVRQID